MGAMTPLSNRDCAALLRDWGFVETGYNGGHLVMELDGRRVQITAPSRSTPTPYKALRKAAKLVGVSLQDFLAGPRREKRKISVPEIPDFDIHDVAVEPKEEEIMTAVVEPEVETVADTETFTCTECGKNDFATARGFMGHVRAHEKVVCNTCGKTFSRMGIGPHRTGCKQPTRQGRRRRPIAEALETTSRKRSKDIGVEVPILENLDDTFPLPEAFESRRDANLEVLFGALMPGFTLTDERYESFKVWVEATRALFASN